MNQPQPLNDQLVEVNEDLFEDEDGFQTPRNSPQPATPRNLRRGSRKGSRANSRGLSPGRSLSYDLANVRPELRRAQFQDARLMQDLNTDLPKDVLWQNQPRPPHPYRTRMPIHIQPGGTSNVSPETAKRNRNSYQRILLHLIRIISIVHADKSTSSQPFIQPHQHLVVFKEIGLSFNPSGFNEAWWENNTILTESINKYLTSEHPSNLWPLLETQTLFKNIPSIKLSKLEEALY